LSKLTSNSDHAQSQCGDERIRSLPPTDAHAAPFEGSPKQSLRRRQAVRAGALAVLVGALAALAVFLGVQHAKGEDRLARMEAIRAQLQIPDDWVLTREFFESYHWAGTTYCNFGMTRCPGFALTYTTPAVISSNAELEALLPGLEWQPFWADCPIYDAGRLPGECPLSSHQDGFAIRLSAQTRWQSDGPALGEVHIAVEIDEGSL
jgi:hypothetical protein